MRKISVLLILALLISTGNALAQTVVRYWRVHLNKESCGQNSMKKLAGCVDDDVLLVFNPDGSVTWEQVAP